MSNHTTPADDERQQVIAIIRRGLQNRFVAMTNPELAREQTITPAEAELLKKHIDSIGVPGLSMADQSAPAIALDGPTLKINIRFKIEP